MAESLRVHLAQIVFEWGQLAAAWNDEDLRNFVENSVLGKEHPELFMSHERVIILLRCRDVLRHALDAFDG